MIFQAFGDVTSIDMRLGSDFLLPFFDQLYDQP